VLSENIKSHWKDPGEERCVTDSTEFDHPIVVSPTALRYEPYNASLAVQRFDSGEPGLDDFLNTHEVREYDKQNLGRTTLVYNEGQLVAFFTTCVAELKLDYVYEKKTKKSYIKLGEHIIDKIPSIKIGRLAVQRSHQNKGIGRCLLKHIVGHALFINQTTAVRLLIVEAKPDSEEFYSKYGFQHVIPGKERHRRNHTMFFDIHKTPGTED
jgi:GNAT superfamily N-acetyltransferase